MHAPHAHSISRRLVCALLATALLAAPARAQEEVKTPKLARPAKPAAIQPDGGAARSPFPPRTAALSQPPPQVNVKKGKPPPPLSSGERVIEPSGPPRTDSVDKKDAGKNARTVQMNFDKRDLSEVIQFVANFTQRNFILPERVAGKITILSNAPIPADEAWNVFLAALEANNFAVYQVGRYWKISEKKQSSRANIPLFTEPGSEVPNTEQMVTKVFKLHFVEAEQMRNVLGQFSSRESDIQAFPPDTLLVSDLGMNIRRMERLLDTLDQPGGSEEIHIVQAQYGGATELAQKLNEIFAAQATKTPGGQKQLGVAEAQPPPGVQIPPPGIPGQPGAATGPLQVSKIIAEDRTNKLIIITNARSFPRVMDLLRQLDVPAGEGGVNVYPLENAKAEDIAATLQALAQGVSAAKKRPGGVAPQGVPGGPGAQNGDLFSGDVKITADKNTNSLVILASNSDYRNVVKVIEKLDRRRNQVFVEAVIMEINLQDQLDFGASLHGGTVLDNLNFRNATGSGPLVLGSELGGLSSLGGVTSLASLGGFLAGIQGPNITIPGTSVNLPSFAILLNAMQKSSDTNVLSTPTVIMTDNSEGEITVGQNVPFQAGFSPQNSALTQAAGAVGSTGAGAGIGAALGLGGLGSLYAPIQRQNVELRLKIKPQISQSEYVRLEVDEQTEEIASVDKTLGPTTSKRSAKTTVMAKDQETVVIGGLIQERTVKGVSKVPILGSIPVLGWLFRNETTTRQRTNLLLFLTPYIIRDPSDYRRIFERKIAERAEFVKRFTGADAGYEAAIDYERKASPLTRVFSAVDSEMRKAENGGNGGDGERLIKPRGKDAAPGKDTAPAAPPAPADKVPPAAEAPRRIRESGPVVPPVVAEPPPEKTESNDPHEAQPQ